MSEQEPTLVSVTAKSGDYQNTAITLRAGTVSDFKRMLVDALGEDEARALWGRLTNALKSAPETGIISNSGSGNSGGSDGGGGNRRRKRTEDDEGVPEGVERPECEHGPKRWANPKDKDWKGWFCVEGKRSGDCSANFVNDDDRRPAKAKSTDEPPF